MKVSFAQIHCLRVQHKETPIFFFIPKIAAFGSVKLLLTSALILPPSDSRFVTAVYSSMQNKKQKKRLCQVNKNYCLKQRDRAKPS